IREPFHLARTHAASRDELRRETSVQALDYLTTRSVLAVQQEAELVEPCRGKALVDDVEGRSLFAHEQHTLSVADRVRDDVGDRLAFAGPGWALHDERFA